MSAKDDYLDYLSAVRGLSDRTRHAYGRDLAAWEAFLSVKSIDVTLATALDAGDFLKVLGKRGLSPRSVNRVLSCLRGFYRWLLRSGRVAVHPFTAIRSLKTPRRLPVFLFEKEVRALLDGKPGFQPARDRLLFETLYSTGCRVSELCALNLADVKGKVRFPVTGKGNKTRWVFLTPSARASLEAYLPERQSRLDAAAANGDSGALFLNSQGKRLGVRGVQKIVGRAARLAGLTKTTTPHTLRHTFATHLSAEGMDVRIVQELLGHSRLETTQVYTHLSLDRLKDVVRGAHPHG